MANEDKKNAALRRIDEAPVRARQTWQHAASGGRYTVVAVAIDEPTLEPVVVYVGRDGIVWTRPLAAFLEETDGQPRFTCLTGDGQPAASSWRPTDGFEHLPEVQS